MTVQAEELDQDMLDRLVQRIVETVHPLRIILFGSAASGRMGPESDLDILVVVSDGMHRRRTAQRIYGALSGLGVPKDVVVVTESDVRDYADKQSLVIFPAFKEGKELYRVAG